MKKNQKIISGIALAILIAFSGSLVLWFFFFREQPPGELPDYPDLTISNYSLEDDSLTVNITNIGDSNSTTVKINVEIDSLALVLYNNSQNPVDIDIFEVFIFSINLSTFESYFNSETNYIIAIRVDPNDDIEEKLENNNEINVEYYYEKDVQPEFSPFSPNTYSLNSSIDSFGYAVQFNVSQILIENSLIITNGTINGYKLVNSTILENNTISNNIYQIFIALFGNQNLTIRNVWHPQLNIALADNSTLSLFNCSIQELVIAGSNNVVLSNSSIGMISSSGYLTTYGSLKIRNKSYIETCLLNRPTFLEIEHSSIKTLYIVVTQNIYGQASEYLVSGSIKNCSIRNFLASGQTNLDIYGTDIRQINIIGKTRLNLVECIITEGYVNHNSMCILNNSKILSELQYGITVYSDSVNITSGIIQGTSYLNNTILINANVSNMILKTIVVNNTGQVYISNFSCNLFLYNSGKAIINDSSTTTPTQPEYGAYLEDSSQLIGIDSSFDFVLCYENSSVNLSEGCTIDDILLNNSNDLSIDNCIIDQILWFSETEGGRKAEIFNSTIEGFAAPSSSRVDVINCSIDLLYEGIKFQSGTNYMNSTGIFGDGVVSSNLNFSGTVISNRTYKYIEIVGNTNVFMNDLHKLFIVIVESGNLTINNCTIESLQMRNNAIVYLNNCSTIDLGGFGSMMLSMLSPAAFLCSDNSHLYINNTIIYDGYLVLLLGSAQTTISYSVIFGIYIYQESRATISYSELYLIRVSSSSLTGYALDIMHSTTELLTTTGWKYQ